MQIKLTTFFSCRFEDGTVSFLSIMALKHGFDALKSLTGSMEGIAKHTFSLARYTYSEMKSLKHANGQNLCKIYCDTQFEDSQTQGPIINFNLLYPDNTYIGYSQVILSTRSCIFESQVTLAEITQCERPPFPTKLTFLMKNLPI